MTNMSLSIGKLAMTGAVIFGAMTGTLTSTAANAALVTGAADITIDNAAVKAAVASDWHFQTFWNGNGGTSNPNNYLPINLSTPGGTSLDPNGVNAQSLEVNSNTTTIVTVPPSPPTNYGRTLQATTMDYADSSDANANGKQVGLAGAFRMTDDGSTYLAPQDLRLVKTSGTWYLQSYDSGFSYATLFRIGDVTDTLTTNGQLSGNLYFTSGFSWGGLLQADPNAVVGTFNLAQVPVPAAVWLFGSALAGLVGVGRKKAALAA